MTVMASTGLGSQPRVYPQAGSRCAGLDGPKTRKLVDPGGVCYVHLEQAIACLLAHKATSKSFQCLLGQQVEGIWRHKCTVYATTHPNVQLPEVVQTTNGNRRVVLRVLPIEEALIVAEEIIPIGLRRMLADVTALMAEMGIETKVNAAEDAEVVEEE